MSGQRERKREKGQSCRGKGCMGPLNMFSKSKGTGKGGFESSGYVAKMGFVGDVDR